MNRNLRTLLAISGVGLIAGLVLTNDAETEAGDAAVALQVAPPQRADAAPAGQLAHREPPQAAAKAAARPAVAPAIADIGRVAPYAQDRVLVRVAPDADLYAIAAELGARVAAAPGRSGYGSLLVPEGDASALLGRLKGDRRVVDVAPMGVMGAASASTAALCDARWRQTRANAYQWHLDAIRAARPGTADLSSVVVAVLDSGVAYEVHSDANGSYVQAPSLAGVSFVSAWDFVNDDSHANDDSQHGTHVTSTIASAGAVEGVAPGVSIMPLKVLDADNLGYELALVEAIHHAVENGADVINMSLTFPDGYATSPAMEAALLRAEEAGIVMVSATGNNGAEGVRFPASSPHVIAVASSTLREGDPVATGYTNLGPKVDLMAPGGDLDLDENGDGVPDGILAETILPGDPSQTGYYLMAGTSQAAAQVSGAAAWLVATGATADEIRATLQHGAQDYDFGFESGTGAGQVDIKRAVNKDCSDRMDFYQSHAYSAAILPALVDDGGLYRPTAQVAIYDEAGVPVQGSWVYINLTGSTAGILECRTDRDGLCTVEGAAVDPTVDGDAHAWAFSVDAVVKRDVSHQPGAMIFYNSAMDAVLAELMNRADLADALIAFHQEAVNGYVESYTVVNMGTGLASSPLGVIITPPVLDPITTSTALQSDPAALGGTGLASSPLGVLQPVVLTVDISGTGLASSPLGLIAGGLGGFSGGDLSGTGLASSPLGFTGNLTLLAFENDPVIAGDADLSGSGLASSPLGFTGPGILDPNQSGDPVPVLLGSAASPALSLESTATAAWLAQGGAVNAAGYAGPAVLIASGAVEVRAAFSDSAPAGVGCQPMP